MLSIRTYITLRRFFWFILGVLFNPSLYLLWETKEFSSGASLTILINLYIACCVWLRILFLTLAFISCSFISFPCVLTIVNGGNRKPQGSAHICFSICLTSIFDLASLHCVKSAWHNLRELLRLMLKKRCTENTWTFQEYQNSLCDASNNFSSIGVLLGLPHLSELHRRLPAFPYKVWTL